MKTKSQSSRSNHTQELLDAMPAANREAEAAVLGGCLLRDGVLDEVNLILTPADFYDQQNRKLYELLLRVSAAGRQPNDLVVLTSEAKKSGGIEAYGGMTYLGELIQSVTGGAQAVYYAGLVRDAAIKRDLLDSGMRAIQIAHDHSLDARDAMNQAEELILAIRDRRAVSGSNASSLFDVLQSSLAELDNRKTAGPGLRTGFYDLDKLFALQPSELVIVAARPSMGKTALAVNVAMELAESQKSVLFFSLEMNALTLGDRILSAKAEVDGHRMREGLLDERDMKRIVEVTGELSQSNLTIDDSFRLTIQEIAAIARRHKRKHGLALVVVDYLQLIQSDNPRDPREQQVARIASRLKGIARELNVPVVCLAQLNRQAEAGKENNRPRLSHLRESGAIEQDADVVLLVHREEYYRPHDEECRGKAEVIVAKNRNGPTGVANLLWFPQYTCFRNAAQQTEF